MPLHIYRKILHVVSVSLLILSTAGRADAITFTVNSTVDGDDANKGNGICATAGGVCTLRAAISEANSFSGGPHSISIPAGTYLLTGTVNESSNVGGDLNISKSMTITGAGVDAAIIDGNGADRVIAVGASSVTISGLTLRNGNAQAGENGGGIAYTGTGLLTMSNIKITGSRGFDGGGLYANSGDMTITNMTISNCSADRKGGGLYINSGSILITNATFSNNSAVTDGGGIHTQSGSGTVLTNVTISSNTTAGLGGGIYNQSGNGPTIVNSTITNNSAGTGGGIYGSSGNVLLKNTIIANSPSGGNCSGNLVSNGYNLDSGNTCPFTNTGDRRNIDPKLGVLQNNGGWMLTHALIIGSPAIDTGTSDGAPATDQRGVSRPHGSAYDMGAYEGVFVPAYQPDAMVRLTSEAVSDYLTDNTYEAAASAQKKSGGAISGNMTSFNFRFQNDGNVADTLQITGTGSGSGFTVQYLDDGSVDRTAAVTAGGHNLPLLVPGEAREWTLKVSVAGSPTPVRGGTSYNIAVTATSVNDGAKADQVLAVATSTSANFSLVRIADKANGKPGEDITYTTTATNDSASTTASNVVLFDTIPDNTGLKVAGGNPSFDPLDSALTCTVTYSNDHRSSWNYTPTSGGCSAPPSYDYCVTDVQWSTGGNVSAGKSFKVGLTVGVK